MGGFVAIFWHILEAITFASSCSIDAFTASFAYGSNNIKIPWFSNQVINVICSFILGLSLLAGSVVQRFLPHWLTVTLCFTILFALGVSKLLDSVIKSIIRRHHAKSKKNLSKEVRFSMFHLSFILHLYADPEEADVDASKSISPKEAVALAVSLSLDGIAVGFGAALGNLNIMMVILASLVTDVIAVWLGSYLGSKLARKLPFNVSWVSGVILIVLAFLKLF